MKQRVVLRKLYKMAVPTNEEVRLLFNLLPDYSALKVAFGFICFQGLRPIEVAKLKRHWLKISAERDRVVSMTHWVYKATNTINKCSITTNVKEVFKRINSEWFSRQLIGYMNRTPPYANNKLFPWTTQDSMQKWFTRIRHDCRRGKLPREYGFLLDDTTETLYGERFTTYRVSAYALRRFWFTFLYWSKPPVGYGGDAVGLSAMAGHSRVETSLKYYIKPHEAINLSPESIEKGVTFDQFIRLRGKAQVTLDRFTMPHSPHLLEPGQATLSEF